jgi:hypothetical protein
VPDRSRSASFALLAPVAHGFHDEGIASQPEAFAERLETKLLILSVQAC